MTRPLHELPLVAFTTLAIAGAGILAKWPIGLLTGLQGDAGRDGRWAAGLLGLSLAVSLAHLGRRRRFPLALRGVGRSALTNEVILVVATLAGAVALALVHAVHPTLVPWVRGGTAVLGSGFLVSLALVYRVPGTPTWNGATLAAPLAGGWLFGAVWHSAFAPLALVGPAVGLVVLDSLLLAARWQTVATARGLPAHPHAFARRSHLFLLRFLVLDVVTAILVTLDANAAIVTAAAGLALERLVFYTLAVHATIESEVEEVEAVIEGMQ
jgi:DMSO reductase anchor subunit